MMKNRAGLLPFAAGGLAFACFIAVLGFMAAAVQPPWGRTLVLLLPALGFFGVGAAARIGRLNPRAAAALTAVLAAVFLCLSVCYVFLLSIRTATTVTTDVKYYERAYAQIGGNEAVRAHFPASVPADAREITFTYTPRFLQGGEVFRLSYRASEEEIIRRSALLPDAAEWSGPDEEWFRMHGQTGGEGDTVRYQLFGSGFGNHGEECCVLIRRADARITFYYSSW